MTGPTQRRVVRERIDPRLTASLFANYRNATDALLELVDNAVDARVEGQVMTLDLTVRPGTIALTAVGGLGMSPARIERDYLRWGASSKRAGDRIGRFGQGGKAAIGHLGDRFLVVAGASGDAHVHAFRDDAYRDRSRLRTYELEQRRKPVDAALGYVHIEIGAVDKRIDPVRLRARLAEVYRPLLTSGAVTMRVDRAPVTPAEWRLVEQTPIAARAGGRLVRGWFGLLDDPPPSASVPGIRIYHLGRLIGEPAWFGHGGPAVHPALSRLVGELELPHVAVTMNKSDVDHDTPQWIAVEERLHRLLAPTVRRLTREAAPAASASALRTADQVRRILARALRLLESGQLFESPTAAGEDGPEGQLTLDQAREAHDEPQPTVDAVTEVEPAEPTPEPKPATDPLPPAPPRPVPPRGGGSRRGFGDVVIRAIDPRVRSAMVEEDGVRRVVINSRYPLYDVRNGDLWYQLETALREVCATIPEATVPEFERKVNELMVVSLGLTRRRRRGTRQAASRKGDWA